MAGLYSRNYYLKCILNAYLRVQVNEFDEFASVEQPVKLSKSNTRA